MAQALKSTEAPIFLVGATGTGKSDLALAWARAQANKGGAAILAMDAMQVHREADIGTSKPGAAERAEIPHGGLDLVEFGAKFDVAQYLKHTENFLREQREAGRRVIVVGGTGLYFRALTRGLCEAPQGPEELRAELSALSVEHLRERLKAVDPAMVERLDNSNPRRLARAIEVKEMTGRSLIEWQAETPEPLVKDFRAFWIQRDTSELHGRIERRVEAMFAQGWVEEVRGLVQRHGVEAVRAFPGIGYREIAEALADAIARSATATFGANPETGHMQAIVQMDAKAQLGQQAGWHHSEKEVKSDIVVATRQYAKRQLTWFSREPNLEAVMLPGAQPISAALLSRS